MDANWRTHAAWLWLPLFLVLCVGVGFYRSAAAADSINTCPSGTKMAQFLHCP